MLMRKNYMLEHSAPFLHHLTDQSNFAYPAYEPPNVPHNTGSSSFGGDHSGAHGDGYHVGSIVPSSGYEIGGLSAGFHGDDFDPIVHLQYYVESDDDEMRD
ncbi:hypothetical protein Tco_0539005 [Tanacetum coccineum]